MTERILLVDGAAGSLDRAIAKMISCRVDLADGYSQPEFTSIDLGAPGGDMSVESRYRIGEDGQLTFIDFKETEPMQETPMNFDQEMQRRDRQRLNPMEQTTAMVAGVRPSEMPRNGIRPGGWKNQPHKTRSKAERAKKRAIKASRRKNR